MKFVTLDWTSSFNMLGETGKTYADQILQSTAVKNRYAGNFKRYFLHKKIKRKMICMIK